MEEGNPGNVNPNDFRLTRWSSSETEPLKLGISSLSAFSREARDWSVTRSLRYRPRLYFRPMSSACSMVKSMVSAVAFPCGSEPE